MSERNESQIMRIGIIALAVMLLVMVASFNIQKLPWLIRAPYHAELIDASGLHIGSEVQVAGIRVGRVSNISRPSDVAGVYGAAGAGLAVGGGARAIVLTNQKGAVLELSGRQVGLMANADLSGLAITLK